ncbi:MAG: hypothetical protein ACFFC3_14300 [Candidatus Odinarchaeota archaeon]
MKSNKELIKDKKVQKRRSIGKDWERRFSVEESRVTEYVELYKSMGFEVRVEKYSHNEKEDCQFCTETDFDNLKTIYIKLKDSELI